MPEVFEKEAICRILRFSKNFNVFDTLIILQCTVLEYVSVRPAVYLVFNCIYFVFDRLVNTAMYSTRVRLYETSSAVEDVLQPDFTEV